ncbi:MAG: hypothetical protein WEB88_02220 [Gemmatimonadota bacterium]
MNTPRSAARAATTPGRSTGGRRSSRGPLLVGLCVSVALHVLAFLVLRFDAPAMGTPATAPAPESAWSTQASRVVNLRILASDIPPTIHPERPTPRLDLTLPAFAPPTRVEPGAAPAPAPAPTRVRSAGERLAASAEAARLSAPPLRMVDPHAPLRTMEDEVAELAYKLGIYNDSLVADWERKAAATDWTIRDADGGRWGVSPGKLHLGSLTLPLPIGFASSMDIAGRSSAFREIEAHAAAAAARGTLQDRGKAVRARVDAARRKNGGG